MALSISPISTLQAAYRSGRCSVADVLDHVSERADRTMAHNAWITRLSRGQLMSHAERLRERRAEDLPLYGVPFAIKDNIDLAGVPTSAGCPAYAYTPGRSAVVVQRLIDAGAIPLGKTNMDQFATGLAGTRSPYGVCRNSVDAEYIAGGSSSGSAVAVALGLASFALGTDTAGSGRVPAAFNDIVGLKPSNGRISLRGIVPCCHSLDCVAIFARGAADAALVLDVAAAYDPEDPYSRSLGDAPIEALRFGVPHENQLEFFGDNGYALGFAGALRRLEAIGGTRVQIDFEPFAAAAKLLYGGAWIAERYAAVGEFIDAHPQQVHPVTRQIIMQGKEPSAVAAFQARHTLMSLKRRAAAAFATVDLIVTPTAGTIYPIDRVQADPVRLPATLGYYTVFMNFFELAGVAIPAGFRADGLPFGISLIGRDATERALLRIAGRL
ncbi:MAG: allophanate hydrolase [Steroidobacterales bacterium]